MANKEVVFKLIKQLRDYLSKLKGLQQHSFEEFQEDVKVNWSVDRGLQLAIECSCDIGREIISGESFEKPETYRQIFQILTKHKVISLELAKEVQRLAYFRNKLIHDYLYLDPEDIFRVLQNDLTYFEQFLHSIESFLKQSGY